MSVFFLVLCILAYIFIRYHLDEGHTTPQQASTLFTEQHQCVYKGHQLKFSKELLATVVSKYNPFYMQLTEPGREKFIKRLQKFIAAKTFIIHSREGYREMPILISATAIQITFGLEKYLLDRFPFIAVHPEEYIKTNPLRVLMGNVQGNTISLSWKHFLRDYSNPTDGKNVGLHEMAHALQL